MDQRAKKIADLIEPAVSALGYELLGVELLSQGKHSMLRAFIDSENGIGIEDCENASRQISAVLDVEDPVSTQYSLEVSSPGVDRPLFSAEQFARFAGEQVVIKLHAPVAGRRKLSGRIIAVDGQTIKVGVDDDTVDVEMSDIQKANLKPEW
ncbi:MAG: ribosome maturation factor RimP [Granulosicoccaceae bacterium]|jgi:ribosome maturation factor RimP